MHSVHNNFAIILVVKLLHLTKTCESTSLISSTILSISLTSESMERVREMEIREDHHEDDTTRGLYDAAVAGSVSSLKILIQKDPLILNKVSPAHFSETPLHISALLGNIDFTKAILTHNWRLTTVRDSLKRLPLLLASAEGQKEIVQALLEAYPVACLFPDLYGRIPLHYAAMRGHAEVLAELMHAMPKSVMLRVLDRSGDTVFHLCVTHDQLECLKLLVEEVGDNRDLLNARAGSDGGVTILELAVMLRQIETIKYLLSLPAVQVEANVVHGKVLNMLEHSPRDFVNLEIQRVLMDAGIMRNGKNENEQRLPLPSNKSKKDGKKGRKSSKKVNEKRSKSGNWVEEKRGMLMVVATMISTMTFQAAINPPGGFWQEMNTDTTFHGVPVCNVTNPCVAGTAISRYMHPGSFNHFQTFNTICFLCSLCITLLLISGFPLHKRVLVWLLSIVMCLTLTFLALTFNEGANMVISSEGDKHEDPGFYKVIDSVTNVTLVKIHGDTRNAYFISYVALFWVALLLILVTVYHTIRLLVWLVKKLRCLIYYIIKKMISDDGNQHQPPLISHEINSYV